MKLLKTNSLAVTHSKLVKEWDYDKNKKLFNLIPSDVTYGTPKKVWWKCQICYYEWKTAVRYRTRSKSKTGKPTGCPECGKKQRAESHNKTLLKKYGSFAFNHPELVKELHPKKNDNLNPHNITSGTRKIVWWKCKTCEHEWKNQVSTRTRSKTGCPECGKKKRVESFKRNRLAKKMAEG